MSLLALLTLAFAFGFAFAVVCTQIVRVRTLITVRTVPRVPVRKAYLDACCGGVRPGSCVRHDCPQLLQFFLLYWCADFVDVRTTRSRAHAGLEIGA